MNKRAWEHWLGIWPLGIAGGSLHRNSAFLARNVSCSDMSESTGYC